VAAGEFVEHATVYGRSYGVLKSELLGKLRAGKDVLLNIDVQGAETVRTRAQEDPELKRALVSIFLTPASMTELETRLRRRNSDSEAEIQKRLGVARKELSHWNHFDYLLISTSKEEDLRRALMIVAAEKMKSERSLPPQF
jgi:guanylate kinase